MSSPAPVIDPVVLAEAELVAAHARWKQRGKLIAETEGKLTARALARKNKRGRMNSSEQAIEDALKAELTRLRANVLPGETMKLSKQPAENVAASARAHSAHHAHAQQVPAGAPHKSGDGVRTAGDEEADADDDGEEDPSFSQFYKMSDAQKVFNKGAVALWRRSAASLDSPTIHPRDLLRSGCSRTLIGVGPCHMHMPDIALGLPLPPCPKHGWASVDDGLVVTWGSCAARRVYESETDSWVVGHKLKCKLCEAGHKKATARLADLRQDELATKAEVEEATAAVKAASYTFRSYNLASMKLYAERYAWSTHPHPAPPPGRTPHHAIPPASPPRSFAPPTRTHPPTSTTLHLPPPPTLSTHTCMHPHNHCHHHPHRYVHHLPYMILNKRTAISRTLARRMTRSGVRSNPRRMAEELLEEKSAAFDAL